MDDLKAAVESALRIARDDKSKRFTSSIWNNGAVKIPLPGLRYGSKEYTVICNICLAKGIVFGIYSKDYNTNNTKRHYNVEHPEIFAAVKEIG